MSQLETETSVSLGTFIRGDRMSYGSRCCYSVSIEVQQPPTHKPYSYSFLKAKILEISIFIKINLSNFSKYISKLTFKNKQKLYYSISFKYISYLSYPLSGQYFSRYEVS